MKCRFAVFTAILVSVTLSGCVTTSPDNGSSQNIEVQDSRPLDNASAEKERFSREIGDSKGVIVLTDEYGEADTISIYNRDGSPWYEFSYYDEDAFDELEGLNTDFKPFAFHPDYFLLALRVVGEDDRNYEVVVNEESDLRKYVRKDDKNLAYEDFGQHILSTFAVDFDPAKNPLRSEPGGEPVKTEASGIRMFKAEKIEGDWLEVSWAPSGDSNGTGTSNVADAESRPIGWVRWREKNKFLLELFYIA